MYTVENDMTINLTRGDVATIPVSAVGEAFKLGDIIRIKVFEKKNCANVIFQKDFGVAEETENFELILTRNETKIGETINKPKTYWYEIELNPDTNPNTIVGYDEDGPKLFVLYPEGEDIEYIPPTEEEIGPIDYALSLTSKKPIANRVVAKKTLELDKKIDESVKKEAEALKKGLANEKAERNAALEIEKNERKAEVAVERARINQLQKLKDGSTTGDAELQDARVDADGLVYSTVGEANRQQAKKLQKKFYKGKNLIDAGLATIGVRVSYETGDIIEDADYTTTDYIHVLGNNLYTYSRLKGTSYTSVRVVQYDSDFNFITSSVGETGIETTENTAYVRISEFTQTMANSQLEQGNVATEFEPFNAGYLLPEYLPEGIAKYDDVLNLEKKYFNSSVENLFKLRNATNGIMIAALNGTEYVHDQYMTSEYIAIKPNEEYIFSSCYSVCYFNENKDYISGVTHDSNNVQITTPENAYYLRFCFYNTAQYVQMNKGVELLPYDDGEPKLNARYYDKPHGYILDYETVKINNGLNSTQNLTLISAKIVYGAKPEYEGYLFYNSDDNGLYFGDCVLKNIIRLCDWNTTISNGVDCYDYLATITKDGDIIFLRKFTRENPIIYPNGNYTNPARIDFGNNLKPYGFLTSVSVVHFEDGSFVFGDYTTHKQSDEENNDPRNIWRVTKPYTDSENWAVAHSFKHIYYSNPASNEPNNEIGHIHTISYDFYADTLYCTTGDIDRHCRVMMSKDKGVTWEQVAVGADSSSTVQAGEGQKYRSVGMVFTEDACYYGTDSFYLQHNLWKAERNAEGEIDFANMIKICSLEPAGREKSQSQATYGTILLRNPNGLLFLERAEPRADHKLDIMFYSFDKEKLYVVATFNKSIFGLEVDERNGLCNQCFTEYQPTTTDFVLCGGGTSIRPNQADILNNAEDNYIGTIKMKVVLN